MTQPDQYVAEDPTVPLALWQSLNREYERVAKAHAALSFEFLTFRRETENRLANMRTYQERCESLDMEGT